MNLERFIEAQERDYESALEEMKNGKKETHWIWYIFPQLKGLGSSSMADYYGIDGIEEARAYLENEYLRNHLLEITKAILSIPTNNIKNVMDPPDDLKLKSSMTLFYEATKNEIFKQVLEKYYEGKLDEHTIKLLKR